MVSPNRNKKETFFKQRSSEQHLCFVMSRAGLRGEPAGQLQGGGGYKGREKITGIYPKYGFKQIFE
jgi:hypothetical protein